MVNKKQTLIIEEEEQVLFLLTEISRAVGMYWRGDKRYGNATTPFDSNCMSHLCSHCCQVIRKNRAACGECFPIWFLLVWALFVERVSGWEDCSISPLDEWKEATAPSLAMRMREQYDRYYTCTSSEKGACADTTSMPVTGRPASMYD